MALDNTTVSIIMASIASAGLFLNAIVHWDKIRPVLTSRSAIAIVKLALIFGCFWFGKWAIIVGANVYFLIVFIEFSRSGDSSSGTVGSALLAAMTGVFNFAVQFALSVNGK